MTAMLLSGDKVSCDLVSKTADVEYVHDSAKSESTAVFNVYCRKEDLRITGAVLDEMKECEYIPRAFVWGGWKSPSHISIEFRVYDPSPRLIQVAIGTTSHALKKSHIPLIDVFFIAMHTLTDEEKSELAHISKATVQVFERNGVTAEVPCAVFTDVHVHHTKPELI